MRSSTSIEEIEIFYLLKEATQKKVELPKNKYELSNHLGNVLVTVSDKRKGADNNADGIADYYQADVRSANDYYAFGSIMPGRYFSSGTGYRFGFNTQEKSDEISGNGNHTTALFWEYDTRLGRRWNLDPKPQINISDYAVNSNNPLIMVDPKGDNDYKINRKGHIRLIDKNKSENHTIYNSDKSNSIKVGLDFFKNSITGSRKGTDKTNESKSSAHKRLERKDDMINYSIIFSTNISELERAYVFFADNSDVEWKFSILQKEGELPKGVLSTSHLKGSVSNNASNLNTLFMTNDKELKLIYTSHSHPGEYNETTKWPAYPSGYTYELKIDYIEDGDRENYAYMKRLFYDRIPSTFNIYIPSNPDIILDYNDFDVFRIMPSIKAVEVNGK